MDERDDHMKRIIAFAAVLTALLAGIAIASPGAGVVPKELARDSFDDLTIMSSGDVVVARFTFEAGGFTGWHSHPGKTIVAVRRGQFTLQHARDSSCAEKTYRAGDTFIERASRVHNGVNEGNKQTVLIATFFNVPSGGEVRIDEPDPGVCGS
jgi:quercetin dioxygenase-like cupin family protein